MMKHEKSLLSVWSFALAAGLTWAIGTLLLALMSWRLNLGQEMVGVVGSVYKGFAPSWEGALWGLLWGFIDGYIGGLVFAAIYNGFTCVFCCRKENK